VGFALGIGGLYVLTKDSVRLTKLGEGGLVLLLLSGAIMVLGLALMVWFDQGGGWLLWALSLLAHYAGLLLLGLSSVRGQLLPRWNPLPLVAGVLGLLAWAGGMLSELESLFAVSLLILALHWLLLGLLLWLAPNDVMARPGTA
jgi:hypothetical protein